MKRGSIVVVPLTGEAGHKARPAVVIQDDLIAATTTVMVVPFTSDTDARLNLRPVILPDTENGLEKPSSLMVDRLMPAKRAAIRQTIGRLSLSDLERLEQAIIALLGMARA